MFSPHTAQLLWSPGGGYTENLVMTQADVQTEVCAKTPYFSPRVLGIKLRSSCLQDSILQAELSP